MTSAFAVVLMTLACTGAGAMSLAVLRAFDGRNAAERVGLSFAVGFGILGWAAFWPGIAGHFTASALWSLLAVFGFGNILFRRPANDARAVPSRPGKLLLALAALAALALLFDLAEATAPPVDGDTLAYHFVRAREFAENGEIRFVPIALLGAIPLLAHVTYGIAYALGGELALTLWTFVSGWAAAVLFYGFLRRWLPLEWAAAAALLFQTVPAMTFGAGSGQVEARLALATLIVFVAVADGWRRPGLSSAALAGFGAGIFAAVKFTGLLMVVAAAAGIVMSPERRLARIACYCAAAALAGFQWYLWNFIHTGDPLFPMLFSLAAKLGIADTALWDMSHADYMNTYLSNRADLISGLLIKVFYPLIATFAPPPLLEGGRIGFGPFFVMIAPMAVVGVWIRRRGAVDHPLFPIAAVVLAFYVLWLNFGGIPKVRHLLPVLPGLLICLIVAAYVWRARFGRAALAFAFLASLGLNFGASALFARPYAAFHLGGGDREAFLGDNLRAYPVVQALRNLPDVTKVYTWERQILYYLPSGSVFAAPYQQTAIDGRDGFVETDRFFRQIRNENISHIVKLNEQTQDPMSVGAAIVALRQADCLTEVQMVATRHFYSRTLSYAIGTPVDYGVLRVENSCPLAH